ncbi:MAG: hypothetical protein K2O54_03065 [Prevotella sp.]|nr:hypothetical protein [Prevotella sp.]
MEDFDFENMNIGEMLEKLAEAAARMKDISKKVVADRISTPLGWYHIQTGPHIMSDNPDAYVTVLAVESFDHEHETKPCGVELYDSREEAMRGHDYWRRACMDNPMRIMKDAVTGEVITVNF